MKKKRMLVVLTLVVIGALLCTYFIVRKYQSPTSALQCPQTVDNHALITAGLYDGPPSELADLIPDEATMTWNVSLPAVSHDGYYVACTYAGGTETNIHLSSTIKQCRVVQTGSQSNIACL